MKKNIFVYVLGVFCAIAVLYVMLHYGAYTNKKDTEALIQWKYEHAVRP